MIQQFDGLMQMMETFSDEQVCIDCLRAIRWKDGAYCPHCGSAKVYHSSDNRMHKCGDCRQRFSIKVGTIFGDTKLPLRNTTTRMIIRNQNRTHKTRGAILSHRLVSSANGYKVSISKEASLLTTSNGRKRKARFHHLWRS